LKQQKNVGQEGGTIVTKDKIIQMTLHAMAFDSSSLTPDEEAYRAIVVVTLMERLPPGTNFKTCNDFGHLAAGCCESCHGVYEHYEMHVEELPSGEKAWICCRLRRALFEPRKEMDQLLEEAVDLERMLGSPLQTHKSLSGFFRGK
jgi:hypothetical protein